MGRPPSNGGPSFRFNQAEIAEMEAILQAHKIAMPERQVLVSLAEKFSNSEERSGKIEVQMKQVWNWFQNRRYAIRAKAAKSPGNLNITQMARDDSNMVKGVPQATQPHVASSATVRSLPQVQQHQHPPVPSASVRTFPQAPQHPPAFSVQTAGRVTEYSQMEYEAKSARDGAWYDVSTFLSHRSLETGDPEALVRFAGFGAEEDEWVNIRKNVRQRSLPCESSECVAVLPADLILCFQEGKEQALYFDAHVLDAQRRRHDVRGCRCRFLVRYDHDQSEEIVALRKICRRPETDYRLQQLHAVNESLSANQSKNGATNNIHTLRVYPPAEVQPKQHKVEPMVQPSTAQVQPKQHKVEPMVQPSPAEAPQKRQRLDSPEVSQKQFKEDPSVQQNQQMVQPVEPKPVVPVSSAEESAELKNGVPEGEVQVEVQKVQPVSSAQDPAESKNVGEVQVEVQKVQSVMHDSSTEVSHKAETVQPLSGEAKDEVQTEEDHKAVGPTVLPSTESHVGSGSAVEVQTGLHEVQAAVPDQPHATTLETNESNVAEDAKTEEPVGPVSTNEPIVVETKTEEPVVVNSTNEAKTEEPVLTNDPNVIKAEIESLWTLKRM